MSDKKSIVLFSTADWDNPFWTNKQHMAVHLARHGYQVLYVESLALRKIVIKNKDIKRIFKRISSFFKGAKKVRENIYVFSPIVIPMHNNLIIKKLNVFLLQASIKYFILKYNFKNLIAWTYNPAIVELFNKLNFKKIIYHSVDDLSASPGIDKELIESSEEKLFHLADFTFVTSLALKEKYENQSRFQKKKNNEIKYYSNVVDFNHFSQFNDLSKIEKSERIPTDLKKYKKFKIGFIGAISEYKVDFDLINKVSEKCKNTDFILIGEIGEGQPNTSLGLNNKNNNVHLIGPRPYKDLPRYLLGFDAVMLPCPLNDYTKAMFPMKFFEYLAANKIVFATALDSLKEYSEFFVKINNADEFANAIFKLQNNIELIHTDVIQLASKHTWESRLKSMLNDIGES